MSRRQADRSARTDGGPSDKTTRKDGFTVTTPWRFEDAEVLSRRYQRVVRALLTLSVQQTYVIERLNGIHATERSTISELSRELDCSRSKLCRLRDDGLRELERNHGIGLSDLARTGQESMRFDIWLETSCLGRDSGNEN